jgi:sec-independent protein translocase protein TatA
LIQPRPAQTHDGQAKTMGIESPVHLIFIAIVALIVLGPKRLPELARSLGHGIREFRQSLEEGANPPEPPVAPPQTVVSAASASSATPAPVPQSPPVVSTAPVTEPPAPAPVPHVAPPVVAQPAEHEPTGD